MTAFSDSLVSRCGVHCVSVDAGCHRTLVLRQWLAGGVPRTDGQSLCLCPWVFPPPSSLLLARGTELRFGVKGVKNRPALKGKLLSDDYVGSKKMNTSHTKGMEIVWVKPEEELQLKAHTGQVEC